MALHVDDLHIGLDGFELQLFLLHELVENVDLLLFFVLGKDAAPEHQHHQAEDDGKKLDDDVQRHALALIGARDAHEDRYDRHRGNGEEHDVPPGAPVAGQAAPGVEDPDQEKIGPDADREKQQPFPARKLLRIAAKKRNGRLVVDA